MDKKLHQQYSITYTVLGSLWLFLLNFRPFPYSFVLHPLSTALLVYIAYKYTRKAFGIHLFLAVIFCFLGDFFLAPERKDLFVFALGSFLLGHLLFIVAFIKKGVSFEAWKRVSLFFLVLLTIPMAIIIVPKVIALGEQQLLAPMFVYSLVICGMVASTILRKTTSRFIIVGAVCYMVSDGLLALNVSQFGPEHINRVLICISVFAYIIGMYLIVFGASKEDSDIV